MKLTPDDVSRIRQLRANGETITNLARQYRVSTSTVYAHLNAGKTRKPAARKLTQAEGESVRRLRREGVPVAEVAAEFGVSKDTVWNWTRNLEPKPAPPTRDECLLAAYPWAWTLPLADREQFSQQLAHPHKGIQESQIDRIVQSWKITATAYTNARRRAS